VAADDEPPTMVDGASSNAQRDRIVGAPADHSFACPRTDRAFALDRSVGGQTSIQTMRHAGHPLSYLWPKLQSHCPLRQPRSLITLTG
jgi:hypothetical protein